MINGIKVQDLRFIGESDRGSTYEFDCDRQGPFTIGFRKAGSVNGRHYHEGRSSQKGPEVFILLHGTMDVYARNLQTGEEMRNAYQAPVQLEISPNVWHEIVAVTDITFIELNSIAEHSKDTKYAADLKAAVEKE